MSSVIRPRSEPRAAAHLPKLKTIVGIAIVAAGAWLSVLVARELLGIIADPNASAWLVTFDALADDARTIVTPQGEYRVPPLFLKALGLVLLAVFLYCLTNLAIVILRIGGWMMRDDAEEVLKKVGQRIDELKSTD